MPGNNKTKTLIIGNGFDLAHHLPTSYSDFINFIKAFEKYEGDKSKVTFDEIFADFNSDWLRNVRKYYSTDNIVFDLTELDGKLDNAWLNYFKPIQHIQTWIDFENEISNALNIVADFCKRGSEIIATGQNLNFVYTRNNGHHIDYFYLAHKAICLHRLGVLKGKVERGTLGNSNSLITENTDYFYLEDICYLSGVKKNIISIDVNQIVEYLLLNLEKFSKLFSKYLKIISDEFFKSINNKKLININDFSDVFSLNYTKTLVNLHTFFNDKNIYHLHGEVSEPEKVVLGIADIKVDTLGIAALGFTKYFQTLFKETEFSFLDDLHSQTQKSIGIDYFVWGHSLDTSDKKYIQRLFKEISFESAILEEIAFKGHYDNYSNTVRLPASTITIYFHSESSKARLLKNLLDIIGNDIIEKSIRTKYLRFMPSPLVWKD
jgi:hypothetical protein